MPSLSSEEKFGRNTLIREEIADTTEGEEEF